MNRSLFSLLLLGLVVAGCGSSMSPELMIQDRDETAALNGDISDESLPTAVPDSEVYKDAVSQISLMQNSDIKFTEVAQGEYLITHKTSPKTPSIPTKIPSQLPTSIPAAQSVDAIKSALPKTALLDAKKLKISQRLLNEALIEMNRNASHISNKRVIAVTDFSLPSSEKRFWIIDLQTGKLLLNTHVSHGKGSGSKLHATKFSNRMESNASSIGSYVTLTAYKGEHGASMRLKGLSDTNSNALKRKIVIHGATYVPVVDDIGKIVSRPIFGVGRSLGCFAFSKQANKKVMTILGSGAFLYAGLSNPATAKQLK